VELEFGEGEKLENLSGEKPSEQGKNQQPLVIEAEHNLTWFSFLIMSLGL